MTYEVGLSLDQVIARSCTRCYAKGVSARRRQLDSFRLRSRRLRTYRFNTGMVAHRVCEVYGVQPFDRGLDQAGVEAVAVNVRTVADGAPGTVKTPPFDGRHPI